MKRAAALAIIAGAFLIASALPLSAQTDDLISGVIVGREENDDGELAYLSIVDETGAEHRFELAPNTEYGLENQAGDRWVAIHSDDPEEADKRIQESQRRFAPVTVRVENGEARTIVTRESGRLETNLGYLFAVFAVSWAAFFAYIFLMSGRQRDLERQIAQLKKIVQPNTEEDTQDPDRPTAPTG